MLTDFFFTSEAEPQKEGGAEVMQRKTPTFTNEQTLTVDEKDSNQTQLTNMGWPSPSLPFPLVSPPDLVCQSVHSADFNIGKLSVKYAGLRSFQRTMGKQNSAVTYTDGLLHDHHLSEALEVRWDVMACSLECFAHNSARPAKYFGRVGGQCHCFDYDFTPLGGEVLGDAEPKIWQAYEILRDFEWHSADIAIMNLCKDGTKEWKLENDDVALLRAGACGFHEVKADARAESRKCFCSTVQPPSAIEEASPNSNSVRRPAPWNVSLGLWNDALLLEQHMPNSKVSVVDFFRLPYLEFEFATLYLETLDGFTEVPQRPHLTLYMPNHEFLKSQDLEKIEYVDYVLCKTELCLQIFTLLKERRSLQMIVLFTSFTSMDQKQSSSILKDFSRFLHLAGKSFLKQTDVVLETWLSHPEWPHITVLCYRDCMKLLEENHVDLGKVNKASNIYLIAERISNTDVVQLMNSIGIHLCPSSVESFGHYANEARSVASLVVATLATPLCEFFVDGENGIGIKARVQKKFNVNGYEAETYSIDKVDLEVAIQKVLGMPLEERVHIGGEGRRQFERHQRDFYSMISVISNLLQQHPHLYDRRVVEVY
jgi:glycosyltransferase involved in cell wall biosynthesis